MKKSLRVLKIEKILRDPLVENAIDDDTKSELKSAHLNTLVFHYIHWADRYIRPAPREVITLKSFDHSQLSAHDFECFKELTEKIKNGDDLSPYLSSRTKYSLGSNKPKTKGKPWADNGGTYDLFLNGYGIHHLHLTPLTKHGNRHGNSDTLLFVGFTLKQAILVLLGTHKSFNDGTLLDSAAQLQEAKGITLNGVLPPREAPSINDQQRLLRAGLSISQQTESGNVTPAFLASAGNGSLQTMHASKICGCIGKIEKILSAENGIDKLNEEYGYNVPQNADLQYQFDHCHFALFDMKNKKQIFCIPWKR